MRDFFSELREMQYLNMCVCVCVCVPVKVFYSLRVVFLLCLVVINVQKSFCLDWHRNVSCWGHKRFVSHTSVRLIFGLQRAVLIHQLIIWSIDRFSKVKVVHQSPGWRLQTKPQRDLTHFNVKQGKVTVCWCDDTLWRMVVSDSSPCVYLCRCPLWTRSWLKLIPTPRRCWSCW